MKQHITKTQEIWLSPHIVEAIGAKRKWVHLGIVTGKNGKEKWYLDGKETKAK